MIKVQKEDFIKDAIENYDKLPQETGELYKRHFINIPFDIKNFRQNKDSPKPIKSVSEELASKIGVKFNVSLGSSDYFVSEDSGIAKVEDSVGQDNDLYKSSEDKYIAFINANSDRSVVINVPEGKSANMNMLLVNSNAPLNARIIINVGNNSKLNFFEYYGSSQELNTSLGTIHEVHIGDNSTLELNSLHNESSGTLALSFCKNRMGKSSHFRYNSFYNGAAHTRVRNRVEAGGIESKVDINEVILGSKTQKFDINTYIVNAAPHTHAELESKAALMGESFCILKGYAKIQKGATKAKSYVHERGILLDKGARVYGLPDMSVDENDVRATHSSATSPVDPEAVFYMMTKGIGEQGVRKLLVTGFFAESILRIENTVMKELSMSLINGKLEDGSYGYMPKMDARNIWVGSSDAVSKDMFKGHYKYRGAE